MPGYIIAIQPNGERIRLERWVYEAWRNNSLTDLMILLSLYNAVEFRESHN